MSGVENCVVNVPKKIIVTDDGKIYEKANTGKVILAGATGAAASTLVQSGLSLPALPAMSKISKLSLASDSAEIKNALDKALEISGMKDKGVKIVDYADTVTGDSKVYGFWNKLKKNLMYQFFPIEAAENGKNAFFIVENKLIGHNQIHINTKKLGTAGFHEIGHSINYNTSKFWKLMQKARSPLMSIPVLLTGIALCKRKKVDGENPKGFFDRVMTFIKNNVGVLSAGAMLPVLAEELKATSRGNKLAKQLLSPESYKKVVKTNRWGAITYALAVVAAGLAAHFANKVRDEIAAPKEIK